MAIDPLVTAAVIGAIPGTVAAVIGIMNRGHMKSAAADARSAAVASSNAADAAEVNLRPINGQTLAEEVERIGRTTNRSHDAIVGIDAKVDTLSDAFLDHTQDTIRHNPGRLEE